MELGSIAIMRGAAREKVILNVGAGRNTKIPDRRFRYEGWKEVRIDVDPKTEPDIVADARHIPVEDESVDAIYCSHMLEHLAEHHAFEALCEFWRCLKLGGELIVRVPDLKAAAKSILEGEPDETLYHIMPKEREGAVRAVDLIYGFQPMVAQSAYMGHRMGWTLKTLGTFIGKAGFEGVVDEAPLSFELKARAKKVAVDLPTPTEGEPQRDD